MGWVVSAIVSVHSLIPFAFVLRRDVLAVYNSEIGQPLAFIYLQG